MTAYALGAAGHERSPQRKGYRHGNRPARKLVPQVAVSLEEAGGDLLNFYDFPSEMWKSLRPTNLIERVNEEFRRRVKTQGSFPNEGAVLTLLFGLIASGAFRLRRIDGYQKLAKFAADAQRKIA